MLDASAPQTPLADPDVEEAILSAILYDATNMDKVGDLQAEDFADIVRAETFAAMQTLRTERLPINTINLRGKAGLSPMGREAIMEQLRKLSFAGEIPNVADLSRQVIDLSVRRQLVDAASRYALAATDGSQTMPALLSSLRVDMDSMVARMRAGKSKLTHKQAVDSMLTELQRDLSDVLVTTGIRALDRSLGGGLRRGDYAILGGRPGAGKSTSALAIALGAARAGIGVLYFTPEMSVEQLALRAASAAASDRNDRVPYEAVMGRTLTQYQEEKFYRSATETPQLPIYYDGDTNLMASEMHARVKQAALDFQEAGFTLGLVVVDHMGKVKPTNRYKGNKVNEVGEISEAMATIAKEDNIAMLALHQLNRQVEGRENKRPQLSDLRACLPGGAHILNADTGMEIAIRDVVQGNLRFNVCGVNDVMKLVKRPIVDAWSVGVRPVIRLVTRTGRVLRCTPDHRVLSEAGWVTAGEMKMGDAMAVPRAVPEPVWGKFMDAVGFVGRKMQSARARLRDVRLTTDNGALDRIPLSMNAHVRNLRAQRGLSHSQLGWREQGKRMSRATAGMLAERLDDDLLRAMASSDVLWDAVVSIAPDGEEEVFDVTVADVHNFVVDNVITHNSGDVEQDADIVMFCYREAYYLEQKPEGEGTEKEMERLAALRSVQNDLEVLLAKNRRGRTGVQKLFCDVGCNLVLDP